MVWRVEREFTVYGAPQEDMITWNTLVDKVARSFATSTLSFLCNLKDCIVKVKDPREVVTGHSVVCI